MAGSFVHRFWIDETVYSVAINSDVLGLIYGRKIDSVFNRVEFTVGDGCLWVVFS